MPRFNFFNPAGNAGKFASTLFEYAFRSVSVDGKEDIDGIAFSPTSR
jgi:hypothetical protein